MLRSNCPGLNKLAAFLLSVCLMLSVACVSADAEELRQADQRSQLIRVLLSRLGIRDRMDLTLEASYRVTTEKDVQLHFQAGSELAFLIRDASIYLYYQDMVLDAGGEVKLERTQDSGGFYLTNFPALYLGDLTLRMTSGGLQPVLTIHVEDYLLGVVPHEMGDSFPLEALKAQAVAARTYALRNQEADADYDVVDTTNDQVFKGYLSGSPLSEQAVRETRGICGFYNGKLAQCYYSASNGGQTERVETVWPDLKGYDYYACVDDPYDVENPLSIVREYEIAKEYAVEVPQELRELVAENAAEILNEKGYEASADTIRIDGVSAASLEDPSAKNSKHMTTLKLTVRLSARLRQKAASIRLVDAEKTPLSGDEASAEPQSEETIEYLYGDYELLGEPVTIGIPVFPDAESAFGLNVTTNYQNEIWTVNETEDAYVIEARRYGHGVGMSQRGAQVMAFAYDKTYRDILSFYYPGMQLMQYPEYPSLNAQAGEALMSTAGPAPSPTPRPTPMPLTLAPAPGQWLAIVTEISSDSSLNLRQEPSLNAAIIMRLYKGQQLLVVERVSPEGWVKVKMDAAEGYVMESFLTHLP